MPIYKSSNSGIPFGDTAGRPTSPITGQPYFNGQLQRLELYTGATYGWQNIVAETPGVTGYTGTVIETNATNTITITGTNFASGATASLIGTDGTEYLATSTTVNNLTQISATFGAISASKEPYDIKVTNPSNLYGVYYDVLTVNDMPIWTTAAGSLGSFSQGSVSYQLQATDEENNTLTYSLVSGSLPTGLTLSSSGLISGTNTGTANTTFNFTVSVSDGINTAQSRVFSMLVSPAVVSGGTLTSDATYYYRTFTGNGNIVVSTSGLSADVLCIGGGGAGGWNNAGGGGAGGFVETFGFQVPVGTHSVTIGGGGSGPANNSAVTWAPSGINTTFGSLITAIGGGGGNSWTHYNNGSSGGSGSGASGNPGNTAYAGGTSTQSSQSGVSGTNGYGFAGGAGGALGPNGGDVGGGGGGGAGGAGQPARGYGYADYVLTGSPGGHGGLGRTSVITGTLLAGGGGGGAGGNGTNGSYWTGEVNGGTGGGGPSATWSTSNTPGVGLAGAGNGGAAARSKDGGNATANTGSGGGGGDNTQGGNGGSGLVVVRYTRAQVGG